MLLPTRCAAELLGSWLQQTSGQEGLQGELGHHHCSGALLPVQFSLTLSVDVVASPNPEIPKKCSGRVQPSEFRERRVKENGFVYQAAVVTAQVDSRAPNLFDLASGTAEPWGLNPVPWHINRACNVLMVSLHRYLSPTDYGVSHGNYWFSCGNL